MPACLLVAVERYLRDMDALVAGGGAAERDDGPGVAGAPRQVARERQRQRHQVGIVDLDPGRKGGVEVTTRLGRLADLGQQPPDVLVNAADEPDEAVPHPTPGTRGQPPGHRELTPDTGQDRTGADDVLQTAGRGKDVAERVKGGGVGPAGSPDGESDALAGVGIGGRSGGGVAGHVQAQCRIGGRAAHLPQSAPVVRVRPADHAPLQPRDVVPVHGHHPAGAGV